MQSSSPSKTPASGLSGTVCLSRDQNVQRTGTTRIAWLPAYTYLIMRPDANPARIILMKLELSWLRSFSNNGLS